MGDSRSNGTAERYEFDAPSHVVDFQELANHEGDDQWFDQQAGGAGGRLVTPSRPDWPFRRSDIPNLPKAIVTPLVKTKVDVVIGESSPLSNIVTSWGPGVVTNAHQRRTAAENQPPAQPRRVSKRKEATSSSTRQASAAPPSKKYKKSPVPQPAQRSGNVLRRSGRLNSRASLRRISQINSRSVLRRSGQLASKTANTEPCSSEEQELERIRNLQREVALHRKKNEASYKAALAGNPPPKKMVLSTTVPKEFNFITNTRIKTNTSAAHKEVDFTSQLRKPESPLKAAKGATVPKPFHLSKGNKRKTDWAEAYVSMAQQIEQFQKKTPNRYHMCSRQSQERGPSPVKDNCLKITEPHTPQLLTRQRSRSHLVKSRAELEADEVEKLQKFKFKAQELNKKILEGVEELKKPVVKEPTVPEGFELQIEKRLQDRQTSKRHHEEEEKPHNFKSQPLPKKILEGVVGLPEKKVLQPTVPESPAFALKNRVRVDRKVPEVKPPSPVKAPPVPHFGLPFQPKLPESHQVEVCPFSFEERERRRRALKEKKLEELRNEEFPQFKAQLLPKFDTVQLPEKKKLETTKPEPFRLLLDGRSAAKSRLGQILREEQKQQEEGATFRARPNIVIHKEPFQPKKEERSAVVVEAFELSTERRAKERQEFERMAREKEALRARMEEEQRREEEQQEKEEITRLRQEQVHKAQPIRHYKPVALKKSELPLTVPHSPNFTKRFSS